MCPTLKLLCGGAKKVKIKFKVVEKSGHEMAEEKIQELNS